MERCEDFWLRVGLSQETRHTKTRSEPHASTAESARQGENKRREREGEKRERKGKAKKDLQMYLEIIYFFDLYSFIFGILKNYFCYFQVIL